MSGITIQPHLLVSQLVIMSMATLSCDIELLVQGTPVNKLLQDPAIKKNVFNAKETIVALRRLGTPRSQQLISTCCWSLTC